MLEIASVLPGSTGEKIGLRPGDGIVSINQKEVRDVIDYRFLISDEHIRLRVCSPQGKTRNISFEKDPDDTLGIEAAPFRIRRCNNRCIFCFVDQMPQGCRSPLYVKDEDFRASFLHGNYIVLSNLSEDDWKRIFEQRLSPLYISVHATDSSLRSLMIGNKKAPDIMTSLRRLADAGIRMHTQIVLCPGINDGQHLLKSLSDLAGLFPAVTSVAVVPVGLTRFRKGLFPLRPFSRRESRDVLQVVIDFGKQIKKQYGTRFVFPSDEFYIKAGEPFPRSSFYEEFPQIENGVGMVAAFMREVSHTKLPKRMGPLKVTAVTGKSFGPVLGTVLERLRNRTDLEIRCVAVPNTFFGPLVTVAGLLTGCDFLRALEGKRLGDLVVLPAEALKEDEDIFLDGMTLAELSQRLSTPVVKVQGFREMVETIRTRIRQ